MPPKAKISTEMVTDAAFELTREFGYEAISARKIADRLNCSTQPVMYYYSTISDIKTAVWKKAREYYYNYILPSGSELKTVDIGLNLIRFAYEEKHLFRLLFQSDVITEMTVSDTLRSTSYPYISLIKEEYNLDETVAAQVFQSVAFTVIGYASLLANNNLFIARKLPARRLNGLLKAPYIPQALRFDFIVYNTSVLRHTCFSFRLTNPLNGRLIFLVGQEIVYEKNKR